MKRMKGVKISGITLLVVCSILFLKQWMNIHYSDKLKTSLYLFKPFASESIRADREQRTACHWPPHSTEDIRNPKTRLFHLAIQPCVQKQNGKDHSDTRWERYYKLLKILYPGRLTNGSITHRARIMEHALRVDPNEYNYNLYPQLIDVKETVSLVRQGHKVVRKPINDPNIPILVAPRGFCDPSKNKQDSSELVVLIKSCVRCRKDRYWARETYMQPHLWGDFHIRFVFGVSVHHRSHGNEKQDYVNTKRELITEANQFGDILIGDFEDNYFSLTLKQAFTFRWASVFCAHETQLFLFLDHDYTAIPTNLIRFVRGLPAEILPDVSFGIPGQNHLVLRPEKASDNRWAISEDEFPWDYYPAYFGGYSYMKGINIVTDMAIASAFVHPLRVEDAHMGILRYRAGVQTYVIPQLVHTVNSAKELRTIICGNSWHIRNFFNWTTGRIIGR
ncbi:unnamed protein product [Echinostoma caproni]|uniref:Hexosyltransferase n=1 Tax=Echinostoma caproni TaxID=27848 RepID=A0A183AA62_9TREM|nr:unnamed protein product [Echinostoma caproni]